MSRLKFRNLNVSPDAPVSTWPVGGIEIALERGDLDDIRRVVAEVRRDPWGPTARHVEEVLGYSPIYGVSELMKSALARARARAEETERAKVAEYVRGAIERSGLSRAEFASRVGTSNSRLSTYASGKVTPSAALLVRIDGLLGRLAETSAEP